jgi:hypothetical protein
MYKDGVFSQCVVMTAGWKGLRYVYSYAYSVTCDGLAWPSTVLVVDVRYLVGQAVGMTP